MRVLYFSVGPLVDESDGGRLHSRTLIKRLTEDDNIHLSAVIAGHSEWKAGTHAFLNALSVQHEFIEFRNGLYRPEEDTIRSIVSFAAKAAFNFPWELQALNQQHVQQAVDWAIQAWQIDMLLINSHASALFLKLPRTDVKTAIVKPDRWAEFYAGQIESGQTHHRSLTKGISLWRSGRFERRVDAAVGKVILINPRDTPRRRLMSAPACVTPYLDRKNERWKFSNSKSAFFIGNIQHFPNRLAVEWIATGLAPALAAVRNDVKLVIVGAARDQVPDSWRQPNLEFLGTSDAATVKSLFCHADLMLCPMQNDFGLKFKVVEALSYGTPALMSAQPLTGFPYLHDMKTLPLDDPESAANMLGEIAGNADRLESLSLKQTGQQEAFIASQRGILSKILSDIPAPARAGAAH